MTALAEILNALAGQGWGAKADEEHLTVWQRSTYYVDQQLDVHWTAHQPPRLHHAWVTTQTKHAEGTRGGGSSARFDNVPALVDYLNADRI